MYVGTAVEDLIGKVHKPIKRLLKFIPKVAFITEMLNCRGFKGEGGRRFVCQIEGEICELRNRDRYEWI